MFTPRDLELLSEELPLPCACLARDGMTLGRLLPALGRVGLINNGKLQRR